MAEGQDKINIPQNLVTEEGPSPVERMKERQANIAEAIRILGRDLTHQEYGRMLTGTSIADIAAAAGVAYTPEADIQKPAPERKEESVRTDSRYANRVRAEVAEVMFERRYGRHLTPQEKMALHQAAKEGMFADEIVKSILANEPTQQPTQILRPSPVSKALKESPHAASEPRQKTRNRRHYVPKHRA